MHTTGHEQFRRVAAAVAAAMCLIYGIPASEAANPKAAVSIARKAVEAYETGDHGRSANLYHEAFKADPSQPGYLYSAARAEQIARQYRKAVETYQQFLSLRDAPVDMSEKARRYLEECRSAQADEVARDAKDAERSKNFEGAEALFLAAWKIAPRRLDLLLNAGLAAQRAGHDGAARGHLQAWLAKAPPDAPDRPQVEARLKSLRGTDDDQSSGHPAASSGAPRTARPTFTTRGDGANWVAWGAVGGGLALVGTGIALWWSQRDDSATLEAQLAQKSGGKVVGIGYADYSAEVDRLNTRRGVAVGSAVVGVAAVGVGGWLLLRKLDEVVVAPAVGRYGVVAMGRF